MILGYIGVVLIKPGLPGPAMGAAEIALNHICRRREFATMGLKSIDHARAINFALHPYDPQVTVERPGIYRLPFLWPQAGGRKNRAGDQNRQHRRHQ